MSSIAIYHNPACGTSRNAECDQLADRPVRSYGRGLIPCPAAITVLLLCLQLKEFTWAPYLS